jgi:molecular chaperone HtpG
MTTDVKETETRSFEADVSRRLHIVVHSVYSDRDVFLRELISNAADACEKLRYEAIVKPELLKDDPKPAITISADPDQNRLVVEDNGIGMSRNEVVEALGTIARPGTRAFMERIEATKSGEGAELIGQFGVGFYSVFMVADNVDVITRKAGSDEAWRWSSGGKVSTPERNPATLRSNSRPRFANLGDRREGVARAGVSCIRGDFARGSSRAFGRGFGRDGSCRRSSRGC